MAWSTQQTQVARAGLETAAADPGGTAADSAEAAADSGTAADSAVDSAEVSGAQEAAAWAQNRRRSVSA